MNEYETTNTCNSRVSFNPLKHDVAGVATLNQNSQLLKYIPEILNEFFTFIVFLQIAFTAFFPFLFNQKFRFCIFFNPIFINVFSLTRKYQNIHF